MQTTVKQLISSIALLGFLAACRREPELRPRLILQGDNEGDDFWLAAPYIAAVKIVRADLQGPREPMYQGGPKVLQLVKFMAIVENMIKGDLPTKAITFFFFLKVDQTPTYFLDPGKRYIISLRIEGGVLRSWADASQLKIWVHSGSHDQRDLPLDRGPRTTIAYILLTPGADCDLKKFGDTLGWPPYASDDPGYINQRLNQLQLHPNRVLRDSACVASAAMFAHRPGCLKQALTSPERSNRLAAEALLKDNSMDLPRRLQHNAFSLFPTPWTSYMSQMFEIYAQDTRPEVRKAACASLRNFSPQQAAESCR